MALWLVSLLRAVLPPWSICLQSCTLGWGICHWWIYSFLQLLFKIITTFKRGISRNLKIDVVTQDILFNQNVTAFYRTSTRRKWRILKRRAPHSEKNSLSIRRFWGRGEREAKKRERTSESPLPHPRRKKRRAAHCEKNSLSSQAFRGGRGNRETIKTESESPLPHPLRKKRREPHCEKIAWVSGVSWGKG